MTSTSVVAVVCALRTVIAAACALPRQEQPA
jgi:hypothetical protein